MSKDNDLGITLVELMVVVAIVALIAAVVTPALTRDTAEADFRSYVRRVATDMRRARYEALSSREDRLVFFPAPAGGRTTHELQAVIPGQPAASPVLIQKPQQAPERIRVAGVISQSAEPGKTYTPPGVLPAEIRFTGLNTVEVGLGASATSAPPVPSSATVFVQTSDGRHRARVVVFGTTAHVRVYDGW
jgi:type II secretory pathway pseudopilin PulG